MAQAASSDLITICPVATTVGSAALPYSWTPIRTKVELERDTENGHVRK